jgi:hypothetical protein
MSRQIRNLFHQNQLQVAILIEHRQKRNRKIGNFLIFLIFFPSVHHLIVQTAKIPDYFVFWGAV